MTGVEEWLEALTSDARRDLRAALESNERQKHLQAAREATKPVTRTIESSTREQGEAEAFTSGETTGEDSLRAMRNLLEADIIAFESKHRPEVRRIACDTALLGDPLDSCFDDREILADVLTLYFTDYEKDGCFVAVKGTDVIGYVMGTRDAANMRRVFKTRIVPRIVAKTVIRGTLFRQNALRFFFHVATGYFRGEFSSPGLAHEYPATLHVNVDRKFRGKDTGRRLMESCLEFLRHEKVAGAHVSTMSEDAKRFFEKLGFAVLFEGKRSYLRYCLRKDLPLFVLGKRL